MTNEQRDILKHALGLNRDDESYRNYYADEPGSSNCTELVEMGFMIKGREIPGGLVYYHVTKFGKESLVNANQ